MVGSRLVDICHSSGLSRVFLYLGPSNLCSYLSPKKGVIVKVREYLEACIFQKCSQQHFVSHLL